MEQVMDAVPGSKSYLAPNLIIFVRVALAFVAIALFSGPFHLAAMGLVLIGVVIYMDALDGIVARKLGVTSDLGALMDITADRIVEYVFWIYFAVVHQVGVWVPIVIVTRSFVVDALRSVAFSRGKTPFGDKTMMQSPLTRFLVASRLMRNVYGFAKVAAFVLLGALITLERAEAGGVFSISVGAHGALALTTQGFVIVTVALNLLRGVPVVWDSRGYLPSRV